MLCPLESINFDHWRKQTSFPKVLISGYLEIHTMDKIQKSVILNIKTIGIYNNHYETNVVIALLLRGNSLVHIRHNSHTPIVKYASK
jgi:hypothetical protein